MYLPKRSHQRVTLSPAVLYTTKPWDNVLFRGNCLGIAAGTYTWLSVCVCVTLTCLLVTQLFAGLSGPLATVVSDPLGGGVCLVIKGQFGRVQPVRHIQETAHAHHKTTSWNQKGTEHTFTHHISLSRSYWCSLKYYRILHHSTLSVTYPCLLEWRSFYC